MSRTRFNPAPGWPTPPEGWEPPEGWTPPDDWPKAPEGWNFRIPVENPATGVARGLIDKARSATGQSRLSGNAETDAADVLWEGASSQVGGIGGGRYRLTRHYLYFESGVLRTDSQQIPVEQITDIDLAQTMIQKARGVATVRVHLRRPDGSSEVVNMENLTEGRAVQDCINQAVRARKTELTREATTHTYLGGPSPSVPQAPAPQPEEKKSDIIDQITRLGELHKAGILSQMEFESKKAELLGRL
ncbi:PH domain-containing protein [Paenarthrobacter nicotinovorans]|uniref:PH domain-containing protein n=1 Tax=Paenarthrobacter nicotinovorans TaxID=29320 RepID=UPI0027D8BD19|nr:PH domain-containing protein [Paenarthrobacter nicotinovorans]